MSPKNNKTTQAAAVKKLREFTNATSADATRLLKEHNWRVDLAMDAFFSDEKAMANAAKTSGSSSASAKAEKDITSKLNTLFDKYKAPDGEEISSEGALQMFEDLSIGMDDNVQVPLSYYLRSPTIGAFTREDYIKGWRLLGEADTVAKQKTAVDTMRTDLPANAAVRGGRDAEEKGSGGLFKRTYDYVFVFARPEGQKALQKDTAIVFWDMLIPSSPWFEGGSSGEGRFTQDQLDLWKRYLSKKVPEGKTISKDVWHMFYDFHKTAAPNFEDHDSEGAWPSMIDEFVAWTKTAEANAMDVDE